MSKKRPGENRRGNGWVVALASVILVAGCVTYEAPQSAEVAGTEAVGHCGSQTAQEVVRFVNHVRQQEGLSTLNCNRTLVQVAESHSQDMCQHGYMSHVDSRGGTLVDRVDAVGYDYRSIGENVAMGQTTAREVHEEWMNSRSHRDNILADNFDRIGVGYVSCGGYPRWTQVFSGG